VRPVQIDPQAQRFSLPVCAATVVMTSIAMTTRKVPRWFGGILVTTYVVFVAYGSFR
jgi:hypothetical protein